MRVSAVEELVLTSEMGVRRLVRRLVLEQDRRVGWDRVELESMSSLVGREEV